MNKFGKVFGAVVLAYGCSSVAMAQVVAIVPAPAVQLTPDAVNGALLASTIAPESRPFIVMNDDTEPSAPKVADPAIARLQVLLDQYGFSPGVIDGFDGDNVRKAVMAFQAADGLPVTGQVGPDLIARIDGGQAVIGIYEVSADDAAAITAPTPADYAEKAQMSYLGYSSIAELVAERFHMDIDFLKALNPGAQFVAGESLAVAITGPTRVGQVARIEADKDLRQVRAYDATGLLLAAYPATIGSEDNPSPSGSYVVELATAMPNYTYNPAINFQQGENTEVLTIPPGPNGPVGSMWIALSKPTYGIHGTPEPSLIDKTGSHGCIRLTNWDADELAGMVQAGVTVDFI